MLYSPSWNLVYNIHTKVLVGDWLKGISYSKLSHKVEGWGEAAEEVTRERESCVCQQTIKWHDVG